MKKAFLGLLIIILIVAGWVFKLVWDAGEFKKISPHFEGKCRQVSGVAGPEDITIHPQTGIAYISAFDRRAVLEGRSTERGIYAYDTTIENGKPVLLTTGPGDDFMPHGISLYISPTGDDRLFVINHSQNQHSIEVFAIHSDKLEHLATYRDDLLISPNDIVAVGPQQFYLTNDHGLSPGIKRTLEDYLKLSYAGIVYFDGNDFSEVASGFQYANGINVSPDGMTLYMTTTIGQSLHIFDRDKESGKLKERTVLNLDSGLDNIELDEEGNLWIGAHPKLLTFVSHAGNPNKISPSQLFRVFSNLKGNPKFEEIYLNAGEELSASSVAAVRNNRMIVGAVFDGWFLDCTLSEN
ncbi:SMP-30/gluconolactonase/LRE family protein [bacterium]|nr:SMP-30/gluconolactonase/LRE family protein [bacterium]